MKFNYIDWAEKHKDSIALAIGGMYITILIVIAILTLFFGKNT